MTPSIDSDARPVEAGRASGGPDADGVPLLELRAVQRNFGPVRALSDVDLIVPAGKVTALVGDNGAGKSTLIKTIAGIWTVDGGEILWKGQPVHIHSPRDAVALGIATMYQDLALSDNLDIVANMFLGREELSKGLLDESKMELKAKSTLADLHVTTVRSIRQPVGSLSGGQRQAVAVARAVMQNAQLVIMDEPTAALGVSQTAMVLDLIGTLSANGIAVLLISHNLSDVFRVADRLAVLYLGRLVSEGPISDYDTQSAVELITTGRRSTPTGAHGPDADRLDAS
jgi:D-xylose transport system ATP-binding protein